MRFKIDWASLIVRTKFTIFALFYFVLEGGGGGAYTWRGLFSEFYVSLFQFLIHSEMSQGETKRATGEGPDLRLPVTVIA